MNSSSKRSIVLWPAVFALVLTSGALIAACGGGGGGITAPISQPNPSIPQSTSETIAINPLGVPNVSLPSIAGFAETISIPPNNAPSGTTLDLTVASRAPSRMPTLTSNMHVAQPFLYFTLNSSKAVTLNSYPGFTMNLPPQVKPDNLPVKIGFYDPTTGWKHIGDFVLSGSTFTFTPVPGAHITLNANVNYYAVTFTCGSSTLPLAAPGTAMPIPQVGGFSGQFIVPPNNAPAETTVTLVSYYVRPPSAPKPTTYRRATSTVTLSGGTVLFWVSASYSSSFSFDAFPITSWHLREGTNTSGVSFYLETFDGTTDTLLDQEAASSVSGLTVNFPGTVATFPIATGHTYWWELISAPTVREFSLTSGSGPTDITQGPDGNLWFVEVTSGKIGRITPGGTLSEFPVVTPAAGAAPRRITVGPDGNLWFTVPNRGRVGQITTSGVMTLFVLPSNSGPTPPRPIGITTGPDGNLWVVEAGTGNLAKVTTGGTITEFPTFTSSDSPFGVVTGPDGNLWVTLSGTNEVARVAISTQTATRYPVPTPSSFPNYIIANSGDLYFEENFSNKIGISTVTGVISEVLLPAPVPASYPGFLTTGPDGHVWFADTGAGAIGTITSGGAVVELPIPTASSGPVGITSGPSRSIWFTEFSADKIGTFSLP